MNKESILKATVERILPEGEALARALDGDTYRVRHAVPQDEVLIAPSHKRRGVKYARLEKVVVASPMRILAACPVAHRCGGCALQYVHEDEQASLKSAWVQHAFDRAIQQNTDWIPIKAKPLSEGSQRRRVRWQVQQHEDGMDLGFFAYQSHDVVVTPHCMVVTDDLNSLRQNLAEYFSEHAEVAPESVYAVQLSDGMHVVLTYAKKTPLPAEPLPQNTSIPIQYWQRCDLSLKPISRPVMALSDMLPSNHIDIALHIGANDFIQGQRLGNEAMIQQILIWSQGAKRVVDLFSGVGNLSLPLAAMGMHVLGAEVNAASVTSANANAKRLKLDAHYQQADLFKHFDMTALVGADVLLVDPPRKGARAICRLLPRLMPQCLILIHCDVHAAQTDALEVLKQGYGLKSLRALDLFPYSGHVESMSLWVR